MMIKRKIKKGIKDFQVVEKKENNMQTMYLFCEFQEDEEEDEEDEEFANLEVYPGMMEDDKEGCNIF